MAANAQMIVRRILFVPAMFLWLPVAWICAGILTVKWFLEWIIKGDTAGEGWLEQIAFVPFRLIEQ